MIVHILLGGGGQKFEPFTAKQSAPTTSRELLVHVGDSALFV